MILRSWSLLLVLFFSSLGVFGGQLKAIVLKQQKNQTSLFLRLMGRSCISYLSCLNLIV